MDSYIRKYFDKFYWLSPDRRTDQCVLRHKNEYTCLVCLAENSAKTLHQPAIEFQVTVKEFTGKRKRNARCLHPDTTLARLRDEGVEARLKACVFGKLLELNEDVNADLLLTQSEGRGYLAVVGTTARQWAKCKRRLLTEQQYLCGDVGDGVGEACANVDKVSE